MTVRYEIGDEDFRPWGHWIVLDVGEKHTVKRITVNAGARLSLQYHHGREEVWTCIEGSGIAVVGDDEIPLAPRVTVNVPRLARHRMANTGSGRLVIIETQLGELLDEDDIVRIEDDFGRG